MSYPLRRQEDALPPWRHFFFKSILGISSGCFSGPVFQRKEQAAPPAVLPPALLFCDKPCPHQVVDGPFHRPPRELQFFRNGPDGRLALSLLVAAVLQVHIHGLGAVRQLFCIDLRKIPHRRPLICPQGHAPGQAWVFLLLECRRMTLAARMGCT